MDVIESFGIHSAFLREELSVHTGVRLRRKQTLARRVAGGYHGAVFVMLPHRTPSPVFFRRLAFSAAIVLALSFGAAARAAIEPGEILIGEMNCAACHEP